MPTQFQSLAVALSVVLLPQQASAQTPTSVDALLNCSAVSDQAMRLACYDREVGRLKQAVTQRDLVILDRGEVRRARRSLFGFTMPSMKIFGKGETPAEAADVARLDTRISAVSRAPDYGLYLLKLAEGGTWQTIEADRNFDVQPGQTIVIQRGLIGNYNAKVGGGRAFRVKRVG